MAHKDRRWFSPGFVMNGGLVIALLVGTGCMPSVEEQTKATGSIIGKKTQDIGKLNEAGGDVKRGDAEVKVTNPITGPLEAYGPMLEKITTTHIDYAVKLFQAEHGRYPKNYEEFMEKIIKANDIQLPVLPGGAQYRYDEKNHKLVIVEAKKEEGPSNNE